MEVVPLPQRPSSSSTISVHSPESTRNPSLHALRVEAVRLARLRDAELAAELWERELPALETGVRAGQLLLAVLRVDHSASRAFTRNQPSPAGARPEPDPRVAPRAGREPIGSLAERGRAAGMDLPAGPHRPSVPFLLV